MYIRSNLINRSGCRREECPGWDGQADGGHVSTMSHVNEETVGQTEAPPSGQNRRGVKRRREIVAAAGAVFAQHGYSGGSIRAIAERVGSSPATLLQHFGSKEKLLAAVLDDWGHRSRPAHVAEETGINWFTRLPTVMQYNVEHRGLIELLLTMTTEASNPDHPAHAFIQQRYDTILDEVETHFREAIEAGQFKPMTESEITAETRTLFAVMDGLELQWLVDPSADLAGIFGRYLNHALNQWKAS